MLAFDPQSGSFRFGAPECTIQGWQLAVEANGSLLFGDQAHRVAFDNEALDLTLSFGEPDLVWRMSFDLDPNDGRLIASSCLENHSPHPISLGRAYLLYTDEPVNIDGPDEELVVLPLSGDLNERLVHRLDDEDPWPLKIKAQFYNRDSRAALQVGFLTFQRANTELGYEHQGNSLTRLRAWCDFAGWELEVGESTDLETFTLATGRDPYYQLETWVDLAAQRCAPRRWEDAPIGWLGWSWVDGFTVELYKEVVLRNCAAIRRRLAGFGVHYVWVSIGNLAHHSPGDWLNWNERLFPDGPRELVGRLKEMGFKLGLWCAPFWMSSALDELVEQYRDALLKDPDGNPLVAHQGWRYTRRDLWSEPKPPCVYALDPSHPQTLQLFQDTFEAYREWGIRYYMIDFLSAGSGNLGGHAYTSHHDERLVAGPEAYHHALGVLRRAAGEDTYLLSSSGPSIHNAGIVDGARTGPDFGEGGPMFPPASGQRAGSYPATYVLNRPDAMAGARAALRNQAAAYYTHRKLYLNDSGDVLTVDKPLPLNVAQTHATIHAMSGGPTMIGDDVDRIDEERLSLIKSTLPRSREVAFPVDLFNSIAPDYPKVFLRRIERAWGSCSVIAIYNLGDEPLSLTVPLNQLKLATDADHLAWEFWNQEYVGRVRGALSVHVAPGSVKVYRLVEDRGVPLLLGTDMHLCMGEMEISQCAWDATERTLSGRALRPKGERGNLFLYMPPDLRVAHPEGLWIAKDLREDCCIIRIALDFEKGPADWSVRFADLFA